MKKRINNQGFTLIELLVVITIISVLATLGFSGYNTITEKANMAKATNAAGNVHKSMNMYASDHSGRFPQKGQKGANSGETIDSSEKAFRELIAAQVVSNEADFSVPNSPADPDGYLGESPSYSAAFSQDDGGVHWSLYGRGSSSTSGNVPLAWENSVSGGWNPTWDPTLAGEPQKGRTWNGAKVVVVTMSGSAEAMKLENKESPSKLESLGKSNKNVFSASKKGQPDVLDPQYVY